MSQEQQITPVPGPTVYDDEQEMLNGNGGSAMVPHPQPGVPDIQGVQREGQVEGVVEEPTEVGAPSAAEFQGPRIFVHTPRYVASRGARPGSGRGGTPANHGDGGTSPPFWCQDRG